MGGLTSNLHLILASFYLPDKSGTGRHKIIYEANAFSSDRVRREHFSSSHRV